MRPRIIITRTQTPIQRKADLAFTTGDNLNDIITAIKRFEKPAIIDLYECQGMNNFVQILKDNFPEAILRHVNTV